MTSPASSSFLTEAPAGRHCAQFHRDPNTLTESAYAFLEAGVRRGQSVLVIASRDHADELLNREISLDGSDPSPIYLKV